MKYLLKREIHLPLMSDLVQSSFLHSFKLKRDTFDSYHNEVLPSAGMGTQNS